MNGGGPPANITSESKLRTSEQISSTKNCIHTSIASTHKPGGKPIGGMPGGGPPIMPGGGPIIPGGGPRLKHAMSGRGGAIPYPRTWRESHGWSHAWGRAHHAGRRAGREAGGRHHAWRTCTAREHAMQLDNGGTSLGDGSLGVGASCLCQAPSLTLRDLPHREPVQQDLDSKVNVKRQ